MRVFIIIFLLLVSAVPVMAAEKDDRKILYWYDPMVPGHKFENPGKSPYMDMNLVPFYEDEAQGGENTPEHTVRIDADYRQALGVRTTPAQMRELGKSIHAFGYVEPDTRREYNVTVRSGGWITGLNASAIGDVVKKGDLLFTYYSPDLMTAQSDYIIGQKAGGRIGNAEQRLRLYGMDDGAVTLLKREGRMLENTPFHAPADGTVMMLNVRKGTYVGEGNTLMTLQDLSQVWVNAHLPVRDLQFLAVGTPAMVTLTGTGVTYKSTVDFIYPDIDPKTRTGIARIILGNLDGILKPNMPVDVVFAAAIQSRMTVPEEAVLYDRAGAHVITASGNGRFSSVNVKTGITADGLTEIVSGLPDGTEVVISGQFMIDAESNLRGGTEDMSGMNDMPETDTGDGHGHR